MPLSPLAGREAPPELLVNPDALVKDYYGRVPDPADPEERVIFGTSGHRGSSRDATFTETHILAITQAICDYRVTGGVKGPLFMGKDTHALSAPAERTALEVLAANGVELFVQREDGFTPTPVISHAILTYNRGGAPGSAGAPAAKADGIVITPSHNPPADGGFKYNAVNGGPADTAATQWIEDRAGALMRSGNREVKRMPYESALRAATTHAHDFLMPYVRDLDAVIDMGAIRAAGVRIGVDPLGGAGVHYWEPIAAEYGLDITVVNPVVDPTFSFMPVDHDGKIRMDCSSPYAMSNLVAMRGRYRVAFANDPDADRHGIVVPSAGLMNPNHYLAVAVNYLLGHRGSWPREAAVGKTLVTSGMLDRVSASWERTLYEVPVGFKWFAEALHTGACCFGGEESAGASFLRKDGIAWTTDKDGLILNLLAAEMTARQGRDPGELYRELTARFGDSHYTRIDAPATAAEKAALKRLAPEAVEARELAGEPILARLTRAPGNGASIGGLKITTANGWFAARPSGTEDIYKIYAESFRDADHLAGIVKEAREIVSRAFRSD